IAYQHGATTHGRLYAVAGDGLEMRARIHDKRTLLGGCDNGGSEWVLGLPIRCSGEPENLCLFDACRSNDIRHRRPAFGECAGLVADDCIHPAAASRTVALRKSTPA